AISLVEPAASGLVLESGMPTHSGVRLGKAISFQELFTGYDAWPAGQLPHGGVSILGNVLQDPARMQEIGIVLQAYRSAADAIMAARGRPLAMMRIAKAISDGISTYYGQYGLSIPAIAIVSALRSGDFIYRTDLPLDRIQPDLSAFLNEVVGTSVPASFYHPLGSPITGYSTSPFSAPPRRMFRRSF
ncbi:MAG TPA: hypothetical protein PLK99_07740, partial [Burkholderiales bacterium]|nr:hypothetical protein [Burkholderiales bacterium]